MRHARTGPNAVSRHSFIFCISKGNKIRKPASFALLLVIRYWFALQLTTPGCESAVWLEQWRTLKPISSLLAVTSRNGTLTSKTWETENARMLLWFWSKCRAQPSQDFSGYWTRAGFTENEKRLHHTKRQLRNGSIENAASPDLSDARFSFFKLVSWRWTCKQG